MEGRDPRRVVGGKRWRIRKPAPLRFVTRPRRCLSGALFADARGLPECLDLRRRERPSEEGHFIKLPLEALPEQKWVRCICSPTGQHRLDTSIDMHLHGVAPAHQHHLMPVVGTQLDAGRAVTQHKLECVRSILPSAKRLGRETGTDRALAVAGATRLAQPDPRHQRGIASGGRSRQFDPATSQMHGPIDLRRS